MIEVPVNERLASVEARLEFIKDLLKEIRDDLKEQPSKEEFVDLKTRVHEMEKSLMNVRIKIYAISGIVSFVASTLGMYLAQYFLMGK